MLQDAGLIRYRRGRITVLDRSGLEARTCECYAVVKREYDRLLPYRVAPCGPGRLSPILGVIGAQENNSSDRKRRGGFREYTCVRSRTDRARSNAHTPSRADLRKLV